MTRKTKAQREAEAAREAQHTKLVELERELGLGPVAMARALAIPYHSYKDLKSGRRKLRPIHERLARCLTLLKDSPEWPEVAGTESAAA